MPVVLKKLLIPHEYNDYHPHITRHSSLFAFALLFLLANYIIFPALGVSVKKASASGINGAEIINLTNSERRQAGLGNLSTNANLNNAALAKAKDMIAKSYWSHFGPNGESPWQFMSKQGYAYKIAGENLAKDFNNSSEVIRAWMGSTTHRVNILHKDFQNIGVAVVNGKIQGNETILIVQMFGSQKISTLGNIQQVVSTIKPTVTNGTNQKRTQAAPSPLPTVQVPAISEPKDGTITNNGKVVIKGEALGGNTLRIFANDKKIGELPRENAAFTAEVNLTEDQNKVYVKAIDSKGNESKSSNIVNIQIDTVKPDLEKIKIDTLYEEGILRVKIYSEEILERVEYSIGGQKIEISGKESTYEATIRLPSISERAVLLLFYDKAGNVTEKEVSLAEYIIQQDETPKTAGIVENPGSSTPSKLHEFFDVKFSVGEQINTVLIVFFALFVLLDMAVVFRKGIHRESGSHHPFNFALIAVMLLTVFTV